MLMKKNRSISGFTLIELLVVIFIIGVLVSLLLSNILGARQRAEDMERKNGLQQMKRALRLYYNDNQSYPGNIPVAGDQFDDGGDAIYIKEVPEYDDYSTDAARDRFVLTVTLDNVSDKNILESRSRCSSSLSAVDPSVAVLAATYVVCED